MADTTRIPAPRVPFIDERTGLMSREWYRYFQNLYTLTGDQASSTSIQDIELAGQSMNVADEIAEIKKQLQDLQLSILPKT